MAAFIATAWITCFVAGINAYCGLAKRFDKYPSYHASWNCAGNLKNLLRTIVPPLPFQDSEFPAARWSFLARFIRCVGGICRWGVACVLFLFEKEMPTTRRAAKSALDILCDIQVVTGTAIVIAGIVQKTSATFYHQQFVMNYWFLTLNSFWAARAGGLNDNEDDDNWHYWTRAFAIFATCVLSVYYQWFTIPRQHRDWDPLNSGFCFISHDKTGYTQNYIWITGLLIFAVYLFFLLLAGITSRSPTWMDRLSIQTTYLENRYREKYERWIQSTLNRPVPQGVGSAAVSRAQHTSLGPNNHQSAVSSTPTTERRFKSYKILHYIAWWVLNFPIFIEWGFLRYMELVAWGDPQSIIIVLAFFGFAAWNTYDLIDLKLSNTYLAADESAWGFGQVLPVVLLGLILLNVLDSVQSECLASMTSDLREDAELE
jgi:hypothetical protein